MTVTDLRKDLDHATLTLTAEYESTPERIWRLWADPRQLERWWGPPSHPATVTDHELTPGGTIRYFMTAPDGEKYHGGWRVLTVEEPNRLEVQDYFADDDGGEVTDLPMSTMTVSIEDIDGGRTRMTIESRYESTEAMEKVLEMGMEEGIQQALGQIDGILAGQPV